MGTFAGLLVDWTVMEEFALLRDIAIIMVVAGAVTLVFRKLRQPPVLGYLIAGLIIGPYALPTPPVANVDSIRLLADLGLVLLLFGLGLEFSWSKIRSVGLVVLLIGAAEIITMISLGYGLGRLMGWSRIDALFLGAAMHISSSALITKMLRDTGRLSFLSSKLTVGILVVEDFAAVIIITVLSGIASTGTTDLGSIGSLMLRLLIFVVAAVGLGALIVPRLMRFVHGFRSREALLITSLGLCFGMAMLTRYLELSVAAGAFIIGALVGDTQHSEDVVETVTPIRDMFAALFFVAIGMLINIRDIAQFIVPAAIVAAVFMVGKVLSNTIAAFVTGHGGRTSLQVGMNQGQMGEFSLAIAKVGVEPGAVLAPLYPVTATVTALTSFAGPYVMRSADRVADLLNRKLPVLLREYLLNLADWLTALRRAFSRQSEGAKKVQRSGRAVLVNLMIVLMIVGVGTLALQFVERLGEHLNVRQDIVAVGLGFIILVLCVPSYVLMWRNVRSLTDEAWRHVLARRSTARMWGRFGLRTVLRDSMILALSALVAVWLIPFVARLLFVGSLALTIPFLLAALLLYLALVSFRQVHAQLERTFGRVFFGEEAAPPSEAAEEGAVRRGFLSGVRRWFRSKEAEDVHETQPDGPEDGTKAD